MNESFIHSTLDEAGLSPVEFRVFAHVLRRAGQGGVCYAGATSMARACRVNVKTMRQALRSLESCGMLTRDARAGQVTICKPTQPNTWRAPYPKEYPTQLDTGVSEREGRLPKAIPNHPTQLDTPEVSPSEVYPIKGEGSPPVSLRREGGERLYPREFDKLIADANVEIKELRRAGASQEDATVKELREKIRVWKSKKLGVDLPPKVSPAKPTPKPAQESSLTLDAVLTVAKAGKIAEDFAREWFTENEHDPTTARTDWRRTLSDCWYHSQQANR